MGNLPAVPRYRFDMYGVISVSRKKYAISILAFSGLSEPWTVFFSTSVAKSFRMVPGRRWPDWWRP
jgi:hypothetical protein